MEEGEGEGRIVVEGLEDEGSFGGGEGKGERAEVGGEMGKRVGIAEEDLGGFADKVVSWEEIAADVGGDGRRRRHLGGEREAGGRRRCDFGGVFGGIVAALLLLLLLDRPAEGLSHSHHAALSFG